MNKTVNRLVRQTGFTMIEVLVAATIIAVLSAVGFVSFSSANQNARNGKRQADMEQVRAALELYRTENSVYPNTTVWSTLIGSELSGFITSSTLSDPKGVDPYVYSYAPGAGPNVKTYQICAALEPNGTPYCLNNP